MPGLRKALKRIGARKKAEKRKGDLMRPGKSATPDNPIEVKKGGRISVKPPKKKGSFPDLSGDGKTTMKDILIGRGVIKKGDKKMEKKKPMKRGGMAKKKRVKAMGGGAMKKRMKRGGRAMKRGGGMMKPKMMGGGMMKKRMKRGGKAK